MLYEFFEEWDGLESMNPFGVNNFSDLFISHGVSEMLCSDIDSNLYLDLMTPRRREIRRIKVEDRASALVFWVYVNVDWCMVSFQTTPLSPLFHTVSIQPNAHDLVSALVAFYHHQPHRCTRRRAIAGLPVRTQ